MAITLLDVVKAKVGEKDSYSGADFDAAGVPMFGGCQTCQASVGGMNSCPSKTGYIQCKDCIGDLGFDTVAEFEEFCKVTDDNIED